MDEVQLSVDAFIDALPSKHSRRAFKFEWSKYVSWLNVAGLTVVTARPKHVMAYLKMLKDEGKAKATIQRARNIILNIYGVLVRDELLSVNPARETKVARISAEPRAPVLTEEQMRALLNLPRSSWRELRDHTCLCLLFGLGWRRAEVAALQVEDFENGTVTGVVKGGKKLTVGVPAWVHDTIDEWCAYAGITEGAILPRSPSNKTAVSGDIVYQIVKEAATRAGLKASPHAFRRTNITLGGERGVSLKARQLAVGHSSQATTERYDKARDAAKNAPGQVFADMIEKKVVEDL